MRPTWSMLIILFISKYMTAPAVVFTLSYSNRIFDLPLLYHIQSV